MNCTIRAAVARTSLEDSARVAAFCVPKRAHSAEPVHRYAPHQLRSKPVPRPRDAEIDDLGSFADR